MNSKKLTALLSFILVMVASLVLSGCHMHTYSARFAYDENAHWYEATCGCELTGNYAGHFDEDCDDICDACGYKADHVDEDKDDACDNCGAAFDHVHAFSDAWESDNENHWHPATCGCNLISGTAGHVDADIDEKCDVCGKYVEHNHTYASEYSYDNESHWFAYTCGCDEEPVTELHVNADGDDYCDVCQYCMVHHHTYASEYSYDNASHWFAYTCGCDEEPVTELHVNADGDILCDTCGFEMYEVITGHFDTNDAQSITYEEDTDFGVFTVGAGTQVRGRERTYNGTTYVRSVKLNGSTAAFYVNAEGPGMLTMIIQNGSSGADTQIVKMYKPGESVATEIEYPGKASDNPMYKLEIVVEATGVYKFQCSGTTDIYDAIFTSTVKKGDHTSVTATLSDGEDKVLGTVSVYDGTILTLNVLLDAVKADGGAEVEGIYTDKAFTAKYTNAPIYSDTKLYVKFVEKDVTVENATYVLNVSNVSSDAATALTQVNDIFYVSLNVKSESIKINSLSGSYSRQISLTKGKVSNQENAIVFTVPEGAYANITLVAAQKSDKTTKLKIVDNNGAEVNPIGLQINGAAADGWDTLPIATANTYTFTLEAGTYNLGGAGGGAYVYALTAEICPVKPATTVYTLNISETLIPNSQSAAGLTQINDIFYMSEKVKGEKVKIEDLKGVYSWQVSLTSGKVTNTTNAIVFTVPEGKTATVTLIAAQKNDKTTNIKIVDDNGTEVAPKDLKINGAAADGWDTLPIAAANTYTFTLEAGTYNLGGAAGGAYIYALSVEY